MARSDSVIPKKCKVSLNSGFLVLCTVFVRSLFEYVPSEIRKDYYKYRFFPSFVQTNIDELQVFKIIFSL